jgi:hypothetical protein
MAFATALFTGAPLIGAAASSSAALPSLNFVGYIQSVSLWSYVLTAAQIQSYMTDDPINDAKCIADYDLVPPRAQNSWSLNTVGIVGNASVVSIRSAGTADANTIAQRPRPPLLRTVTHMTPRNLRSDDLSPDIRRSMVAEFRTFMTARLGFSGCGQLLMFGNCRDAILIDLLPELVPAAFGEDEGAQAEDDLGPAGSNACPNNIDVV